jgi:hypothetical protein
VHVQFWLYHEPVAAVKHEGCCVELPCDTAQMDVLGRCMCTLAVWTPALRVLCTLCRACFLPHIRRLVSSPAHPRDAGAGVQVVCVSAAKHHTLVTTSAGEVFSWGSNNDGRLGYPAVDNQPHPRK